MQAFNVSALEAIIQQYEADINTVRASEVYKWEAAHCFQQHWDPSAQNFAAMIGECVAKAGNLLTGANWYAAGMLKTFAAGFPEKLKQLMIALFDEQKPLRQRLERFEKGSGELLELENAEREKTNTRLAMGHFQDARSMSVYLAFANPRKNYLYKSGMYKKFANAIGVSVPGNKFDKVVEYQKLCNEILEYLESNHGDLLVRSDNMIKPEYVNADPNHHILVQDIVYYVDAYMKSNPKQHSLEPMQRVWMYSPGEGAEAWNEFKSSGIMGLGWDELGDHAQYSTQEVMKAKLDEVYGPEGSKKNTLLACWQFQHVMKPGDVVYAKKGMAKIIGKGIVKSGPRYEPQREHYRQVRDVEWVKVGSWDASDIPIPQKTLTDWTPYPDECAVVEKLINGGAASSSRTTDEKAYWFLVANPKMWSFASFAPNEEDFYTLYNEKGNPRRIPKHFLSAKPGDMIVGYESQPAKKTVALCEVSREHDDEKMYFRKVCDLTTPVTFEQISKDELLSQMEFMRNYSGSLFALSEAEFSRLMEMSGLDISSLEDAPEPYTDADYLSQVFMDAADLAELKALLKRKKNLILQGAPGTGKTFAAKRLAWTMMGCKDSTRIQQVQFHQSTTYDGFVYGYRPNADGGFETVPGAFVEFCRKASSRPSEDFFFIIDEINRANISKVLGELLMLIEADHRGESIILPVSGESFFVPPNVFIIGMMNTADRGLALIDYALRRRFAFFEMEPALKNDRFEKQAAVSGEKMTSLVYAVIKLNDVIEGETSLGRGFRIGHSYFCPDADGNPIDPASVVKYELAPLVEEYWFDDEKRAHAEIDKLKAAAE